MPTKVRTVPTADQAFATWSQNFVNIINVSYADYQMTAGDAAGLNADVQTFLNALTINSNPASRTKATTAAKNATKKVAVSSVRYWVKRIQQNPNISTTRKAALGVPTTAPYSPPTPPPTTQPALQIRQIRHLSHVLDFHDLQLGVTQRALPPGVYSLHLYGSAAANPPGNPDSYQFIGARTRTPTTVHWPSTTVGLTAWYIARWATARGITGPWGAPASATIAG